MKVIRFGPMSLVISLVMLASGLVGILWFAGPSTEDSFAADDSQIVAIRSAWPQIVSAIGRNPANRPLVTTCRPVEVRDGLLQRVRADPFLDVFLIFC